MFRLTIRNISNNVYSKTNVHCRNVERDDAGNYMCQVNTDPMISQTAWLREAVKIEKKKCG